MADSRPRPRVGSRQADTEDPIVVYLRRQDERDKELAKALHRLADVGEEGVKLARQAVEDVRPAVEFFGDAGRRLDALCMFLRKWGPWFLASTPLVVMMIGAITPNAAARLGLLITAIMGHP